MPVKRYSPVHMVQGDYFDQITPNFITTRETRNPAGEFYAADWLPILFTKVASDWPYVCSGGKVVGLDGQGRIYPAGLRKVVSDATAVADAFITYTSLDVEWSEIDIRTGAAVVTAGIGAVSLADAADGLLARGLVDEAEVASQFAGANYSNTSLQDVQAVILAFLSEPCGFLPYDMACYYAKADGFPKKHNFEIQKIVQWTRELQLKMPVLASTPTTSTFTAASTVWAAAAGDGEAFPSGEKAGSVLTLTAALAAGLDRYSALLSGTEDLTGLVLEHAPVARPRDGASDSNPTDLTASDSTLLVRKRASVDAITKAGDYFLDAEVGILFVHGSTYTAAVGAGNVIITYSYYDSAAGAAGPRYVHFSGWARPGAYVTYDKDSNFIPAVAATPAADKVGRVLFYTQEPRGLLDRVKTAWEGESFASSAKMPGTATKGYSDNVTINSGPAVADLVVNINGIIN